MSYSDYKELIPIGEMAKISGFPVSKLRYYHDIGLLKAKKVDELTNYRYYSHEQLYIVNFLSSWKGLDFSISEINKIYEKGDINLISDLYQKKYNDIKQKIENLKNQASILKEELLVLEDVKSNKFQIEGFEVITSKKKYVISVLKKAPGINFSFFFEAKNRVCELAHKHKMKTYSLSRFSATFLDFPSEDFLYSPIEYTLPLIEKPKKMHGFIKEIPERQMVKSIYKGDFANEDKLYNFISKLRDKIDSQGLIPTGGITAVFKLHSWTIANNEEHITEFYVPIKNNL